MAKPYGFQMLLNIEKSGEQDLDYSEEIVGEYRLKALANNKRIITKKLKFIL